MGSTELTLTLQDLFIADHAIRERLQREGISEEDKAAEENTLDVVNGGIHQILREKR